MLVKQKAGEPTMAAVEQKHAGSLSYTPEFDGLRALAVFAVLIYHYQGGFLDLIANAVPLGLYGVRLFFVLSGFLITSILINANASAETGTPKAPIMRSFYGRRFLRILPAYYLLLLLMFIGGDESFRQVMWWHAAYLSNTVSAVYSEPFASGALIDPATSHLWSLSVEAQFYLIWPFLMLFISKRSLVALAIFLIALGPIARAVLFVFGYLHDPNYLVSTTDPLAAGALLAMWKAGWIPWLSREMIAKLTFTAAAIFAACVAMSVQDLWYRPSVIFSPFAESFLFAWLLLVILEGKLQLFAKFLRTRWLIYIGKISYGVYLYHALVWNVVADHIIDLSDSHRLAQGLIATIATILFATVSWQLIEKPLLGLKRRLG